MEIPLENINGRRDRPDRYKRIWQIESNYGLSLLCLGLLNTGLLTVAVAMAITCAHVKGEVPPSAAGQLLNELEDLRSRHSDVTKDVEQTKQAIAKAVKDHTNLMKQIEKQKTVNDRYRKQIKALKSDLSILKSNVSASEGNCGKCLPGWMYFNSSCYFFSFTNGWQHTKVWRASRADCIMRGADLVVIDSQEEQMFVNNNIETRTSITLKYRAFWLGLTDVHQNGTWVWINNVTEVHLMKRHSGKGGCAITYYHSPTIAVLNPASCDWDSHNWICEMQSRF